MNTMKVCILYKLVQSSNEIMYHLNITIACLWEPAWPWWSYTSVFSYEMFNQRPFLPNPFLPNPFSLTNPTVPLSSPPPRCMSSAGRTCTPLRWIRSVPCAKPWRAGWHLTPSMWWSCTARSGVQLFLFHFCAQTAGVTRQIFQFLRAERTVLMLMTSLSNFTDFYLDVLSNFHLTPFIKRNWIELQYFLLEVFATFVLIFQFICC